jgi:uncharacterized protein with HEPN domain
MNEKMGDKQRLQHILTAISEIELYISGVDLPSFLSNSMMRFASVKQIEIIGEAANYLSAEIKEKFSEVEWGQIVSMRHILVHEYFGIDSKLVWQVVVKDIPALKEKVTNIVSQL